MHLIGREPTGLRQPALLHTCRVWVFFMDIEPISERYKDAGGVLGGALVGVLGGVG